MSDAATAPLPYKIARLRIMMFMEYASRGVWIPIAGKFLSAKKDQGGLEFTETEIGYTLGVALAVGALCSPFIAASLADRRFATQKVMAILLILGGTTQLVTGYQTSFTAWFGLSIVYAILFVPTMSLSNSLAMSHLDDPKQQYPGVRVWGTIGWIVVSWLFPMIWLQTDLKFRWLPPFFTGDDVPMIKAKMIDSVKVAGMIGITYGVFCWYLLPNTRPKKKAKSLALWSTIQIYRQRSMAILLVSTLIVGTVHTLYFIQASKFLPAIGLEDAYIAPAMSLGQFAEIGAMAVLGLLLRRIGFRNVMLIGAGCYVLRYLIFACHEWLPLSVIVASQALHGLCFACFYAAGFIYVDRMAPTDAKHSTQTIFGLMCFGIGPFAGGILTGALAKLCTSNDVLNYSQFWLAAAAIGLAGFALLALQFRDESAADPATEPAAAD
jgi:MFS family permease